MNERILEIAKQCGYWSGQTIEMNDVGIEKFTELIVAEVIDKIESVGFKSSNDIPFEITDLFVGQIKQHFGVDNK